VTRPGECPTYATKPRCAGDLPKSPLPGGASLCRRRRPPGQRRPPVSNVRSADRPGGSRHSTIRPAGSVTRSWPPYWWPARRWSPERSRSLPSGSGPRKRHGTLSPGSGPAPPYGRSPRASRSAARGQNGPCSPARTTPRPWPLSGRRGRRARPEGYRRAGRRPSAGDSDKNVLVQGADAYHHRLLQRTWPRTSINPRSPDLAIALHSRAPNEAATSLQNSSVCSHGSAPKSWYASWNRTHSPDETQLPSPFHA
jgi:hypothetical protein